jgi:RNA recognition motif-containing protein
MKLYIGNLSFDTTTQDLRTAFEAAGTVTDAIVMQDKMSGRSRGFGFVTMGSAEEGTEAIRQFNGKPLDGRNLTVNEARPREEFAPRGGGGGGGRKDFGGGRKDYGDRRGGGGYGDNRRSSNRY